MFTERTAAVIASPPKGRANPSSLGTDQMGTSRARRLLDADVEFVPNPAFEREGLGLPEELLPALDSQQHFSHRCTFNNSATGERLLSKEDEAYLFCRMNYLKFRAHRLREQLDADRPNLERVELIERLLDEALQIRNYIVAANSRLVIFVVKTFIDQHTTLPELVSDGSMALMRAVEKFDFARGYRFSTYATWAIRNYCTRRRQIAQTSRERYQSGYQENLDWSTSNGSGSPSAGEERHQFLLGLLGQLPDRQRAVIEARFAVGTANRKQTLAEIGKTLGISKERVRQIAADAMDKLRELAQSQSDHDIDL